MLGCINGNAPVTCMDKNLTLTSFGRNFSIEGTFRQTVGGQTFHIYGRRGATTCESGLRSFGLVINGASGSLDLGVDNGAGFILNNVAGVDMTTISATTFHTKFDVNVSGGGSVSMNMSNFTVDMNGVVTLLPFAFVDHQECSSCRNITQYELSSDMTTTNVQNNITEFVVYLDHVRPNGVAAPITNNAPFTPTILFPTDNLFTTLKTLDINVTFPAECGA